MTDHIKLNISDVFGYHFVKTLDPILDLFFKKRTKIHTHIYLIFL